MKLKELVQTGNTVKFKRYHAGNLWYVVVMDENDFHNGLNECLEFPVPISDCGEATFLAEDKAILFMRYIRKHLETIEKGNVPAGGD